jgi:hypothetical protein
MRPAASPRERHPTVAPAVGGEQLVDGTHGAARSVGDVPGRGDEAVGDGLDLALGGQDRPLEAVGPRVTRRQEPQRPAHAAHREALARLRLEALAHDQLGRPAANVDHEPTCRLRSDRVRDTEVDQARLLLPRHNLDRVAERLFCAPQEGGGVDGPSERAGAERPDPVSAEPAQSLPEPLEHREGPPLHLDRQPVRVVESAGELHALLEAIDHLQVTAHLAGDDHVEAVRAKVNSGEELVGR